jgi:Fe-S-cluster-containing dehydrogenase component
MDRKTEGPATTASAPAAASCDRRGFLRWAGFSAGASLLGACSPAPVEKVIPYLVQPEETTPGEAVHYASVCAACPAGCGVLGKCLDGRPVKLEGNPAHPISRGGLCAIGQASILDLYDSVRLRQPLRNRRPVPWPSTDESVRSALEDIRRSDSRLYLLSRTVNSPHLAFQIRRFLGEFPDTRWVSYDPVSRSAVAAAHELTHGVRICPTYRIDRAEAIVAIEDDFLGPGISPVEFAQDYRDGRSLEGSRLRYSHHIQFESFATSTGSKADYRHLVPPGSSAHIAVRLAAAVARRLGTPFPDVAAAAPGISQSDIDGAAERLTSARTRSLVLCGAQDLNAQIAVNFLNHALQNYDRTIEIQYPSFQRLGWEADLALLLDDLEGQRVGGLIVADANPLFELPFADRLRDLVRRVPLKVFFGGYLDETAEAMDVICATPHFLESWGDSQPTSRVLAIRQPFVGRLGETRTISECLSAWLGEPVDDLTLVRRFWEEHVFPRRVGFASFEEFWNATLTEGLARIRPQRVEVSRFRMEALDSLRPATPPEGLVLQLRPSRTLGDGRRALNPWLQELPDPLTRQSWGNCLEVSPGTAESLEIARGRLVRVLSPETPATDLPVLPVSGHHERSLGAALGHGRRESGGLRRLAPDWIGSAVADPEEPIGVNLFSFVVFDGRFLVYERPVELEPLPKSKRMALVQRAGAERRAGTSESFAALAIRSTTLEALLATRPVDRREEPPGLWPEDHDYSGHHWGMVVDLGACTGCSACVVACQAENNIPVVGEDEIARDRGMHWIRIDRYTLEEGGRLEYWFQPMLCQHCDRAPCETVCPVLATVHSSEGLNEQIYNRCIGTRYCANNCPYKVRAFNWFEYRRDGRLENLQLNPQVTVRARGIAEKCTFCTQRIQSAKIESRTSGEPPRLRTACQQTCPSRAIVFGDMNDPTSEIATLLKSPRAYRVLDHLGTRPSVYYLAGVHNRPADEEAIDG